LKVPICYECKTNRGLVDVTTPDDKTWVFECAYCGHKASTIDERRLDVDGNLLTTEVGKVIGDFNSATSYAIRSFTSGLGKVRMVVSTNSNFCHSITIDGKASKSLKRFIDEDFSEDTYSALWTEFLGKAAQAFMVTVRIRHIMHMLQTTVNNVVELDLD
jgi:hypothetical protein